MHRIHSIQTACLVEYEAREGGEPPEEYECSHEQLSCLKVLLSVSFYVEFAVFGPHPVRSQRKLKFSGMVFDGGWDERDPAHQVDSKPLHVGLTGPPTYRVDSTPKYRVGSTPYLQGWQYPLHTVTPGLGGGARSKRARRRGQLTLPRRPRTLLTPLPRRLRLSLSGRVIA